MAEIDLEALRLAFLLHVTELVVQADQVTTRAEAEFVARVFPTALLCQHGFADADGAHTPKLQEAAVQALDVLPERLSLSDKRVLLDCVFDAAIVDAEFRLGEGSVVLMAARLLGVSDEDFDAFLGNRREADGVTVQMLEEP